jgi:GH25 family lysozyme M1 (1,4-beta-N-acetylmuramidase)
MNGVDISHYQKGLTIRQIREAGHDFAVIKLTEGARLVDSAAFGFYREAYELGFPVGCYCYSHARNADEAGEEAAFLLETLRGFPMPCGIFLDVEEPEQLALSHDGLLALVRAWCAGVRAGGYIPGIYGSAGTLWSKVRADELPEDCLVWVAKWGGTPPALPCDLWQTGDSGRIGGYGGCVDTDRAQSARFEALVKGASFTQPRTATGGPEPEDLPAETEEPPPAPDISGALAALAAYLQTEDFRAGFLKFLEGSASK